MSRSQWKFTLGQSHLTEIQIYSIFSLVIYQDEQSNWSNTVLNEGPSAIEHRKTKRETLDNIVTIALLSKPRRCYQYCCCVFKLSKVNHWNIWQTKYFSIGKLCQNPMDVPTRQFLIKTQNKKSIRFCSARNALLITGCILTSVSPWQQVFVLIHSIREPKRRDKKKQKTMTSGVLYF